MKERIGKKKEGTLGDLVDFLETTPLDTAQRAGMLRQVLVASLRKTTESASRIAICNQACDGSRRLFEEELSNAADQSVMPESPASVHLQILWSSAKEFFKQDLLEKACALLEEVHRLAAHDFLGARYLLPGLFLASKRIDDARQLIERYADTSGLGLFNLALVDAASADPEFEIHAIAASAQNPHVVKYLLGVKQLPAKIAADFSFKPGSVPEAAWYAFWIGRFWKEIPEALLRLRAVSPRLHSKTSGRGGARADLLPPQEIEAFAQKILATDLSSRPKILALLVAQARFLFDRSPWLRYQEQPVYIPLDEERTVVAQHSGGLGELFGANIFLSEAAFDLINEVADMSISRDTASQEIAGSAYGWMSEALWLHVEDLHSLPPQLRREVEKLHVDEHRAKLPVPQMKRRGYAPWLASDEELLFGVVGLYGLTVQATTTPRRDDSVIVAKLASYSKLQKHLCEAIGRVRPSFGAVTASTESDELKGALRKLESAMSNAARSDQEWELGFVGSIGCIQARPTDRPEIACAALVVDKKSGFVIATKVISGNGSPARLALKALREAVKATFRLPKEVHVLRSVMSLDLPQKIKLLPLTLVEEAPALVEAAVSLRSAMQRDEVVYQ